jgi:multidrug efflux pump subunit AcrA (membrane-fusion protein)
VISSQQGLKYVFVVKADNTIERRNIETSTLFEGKRIVKSGLKEGEKVVSTRPANIASRYGGYGCARADASRNA